MGPRLAIITNGGGPGVLAADWIEELGLQLARLSDDAARALAPHLHAQATLTDLLDLSEEADANAYGAAIQACARDQQIDGILVIYSPKLGGDPDTVARRRRAWRRPGQAAADLLDGRPPGRRSAPDHLTEMESKALLAASHIPITQTILARSANEAMLIASQLGYPLALKIDSPDIAHKSDVHGVVLNLNNAASVRDAYSDMMATVRRLAPKARINGVTVQKMAGERNGRELYIGVATDDLFGPAISRFSGQGFGTRLMLAIMDVARDKGPSEIDGLVLCKNSGMLTLMASLGFQIRPYAEDLDFRLCSKAL